MLYLHNYLSDFAKSYNLKGVSWCDDREKEIVSPGGLTKRFVWGKWGQDETMYGALP